MKNYMILCLGFGKDRFFLLSMMLAVCFLITGCQKTDLKNFREDNSRKALEYFKKRKSFEFKKPVTLEKAITLALENNLDYRLLIDEIEIADEQANGAMLGMLPKLTATGNYSKRNRDRVATSQNASTGVTSLAASKSSEKESVTGSLKLAWSALDFGISYFRSRQADNQVLISEQRYRRAEQNLKLEVTRAYYRAFIAKIATAGAKSIIERIEKRQVVIEQQIKNKTLSIADGLENKLKLGQMKLRFEAYVSDYISSKTELINLMGFAPGSSLKLKGPSFGEKQETLKLDLAAFEKEALRNRPELIQKDLEELISQDEIHIAIAKLFPNVEVFVSGDHDDNKFLKYNDWTTLGASAALDLLSLPKRWSEKTVAENKTELVKKQRLALAFAILSQVHLATIKYKTTLERSKLIYDISKTQEALSKDYLTQARNGKKNADQVLDKDAQSLFSRIQYLNSYAEFVVAKEQLKNTLGRDTHNPAKPEVKTKSQKNKNSIKSTGNKKEQSPSTPAKNEISDESKDVKVENSKQIDSLPEKKNLVLRISAKRSANGNYVTQHTSF